MTVHTVGGTKQNFFSNAILKLFIVNMQRYL